jgi:hypothetical protein
MRSGNHSRENDVAFMLRGEGEDVSRSFRVKIPLKNVRSLRVSATARISKACKWCPPHHASELRRIKYSLQS